jgi:hypothetical protein
VIKVTLRDVWSIQMKKRIFNRVVISLVVSSLSVVILTGCGSRSSDKCVGPANDRTVVCPYNNNVDERIFFRSYDRCRECRIWYINLR